MAKRKNLKLHDLVQIKYAGKEVTGVITEFDSDRPGVTLSNQIIKFCDPKDIIKVW